MSRLIETTDLNNLLQIECDRFGILRTEILSFINDVVSKCPTADIRDHIDLPSIVTDNYVVLGYLRDGIIAVKPKGSEENS